MEIIKRITVNDILSIIKSGQRIFLEGGVGEPLTLMNALVSNCKNWKSLEVLTTAFGGNCSYKSYLPNKEFKMKLMFSDPKLMEAMKEHRIDYIPCSLLDIPKLLSEVVVPEVAIVHLSNPDAKGNCSFGTACDFNYIATKNAKIVIAQINEQMPFTFGHDLINVEEIDYALFVNEPLVTFNRRQSYSPEECTISEYVSDLIDNGSTIQVGIGSLPDAILSNLLSKKDLGIHSGVISDAVVDLMERGVINNSKKEIDKGYTVSAMIAGTKQMQEWANLNDKIRIKEVSYTHSPLTISSISNFVSVNSAIDIDITGQINGGDLNNVTLSGTGGQLDFIRGASLSKNGKSVIAMTSTANHGKASRILTRTTNSVTVPRSEADYIVTEFGIARLKGKTISERVREMLRITHPKFKDIVISELKQLNI